MFFDDFFDVVIGQIEGNFYRLVRRGRGSGSGSGRGLHIGLDRQTRDARRQADRLDVSIDDGRGLQETAMMTTRRRDCGLLFVREHRDGNVVNGDLAIGVILRIGQKVAHEIEAYGVARRLHVTSGRLASGSLGAGERVDELHLVRVKVFLVRALCGVPIEETGAEAVLHGGISRGTVHGENFIVESTELDKPENGVVSVRQTRGGAREYVNALSVWSHTVHVDPVLEAAVSVRKYFRTGNLILDGGPSEGISRRGR